MKKAVIAELRDWADEERARTPKPDYILFATNVRLSAVANGGKDEIKKVLADAAEELGLGLKEGRVWDYDDLRTLLDDAKDIRVTYAAFLTPGDILARLAADLDWNNEAFSTALVSHAGATLLDDNSLNLTQAGGVSDKTVGVSDVIVDLPAAPSSKTLRMRARYLGEDMDITGGISAQLIRMFNQRSTEDEEYSTRRAVVIGGPGQGKSTVTQWLAQIYRANFLRYTRAAVEPDLKKSIRDLDCRHAELDLPTLEARRWPYRIKLTEFADYLARIDGGTVLEYIAQSITRRSPVPVATTDIMKWLGTYPWVLLIDGLDEVPSTSNRVNVMRAIQDFFITAATVEADIAVVATTRPQGYNEEFPPDKYIEFKLSPLDKQTALDYANGLVCIRHGVGTSMSDRVNERLARAIEDGTTMRLMETPLQVTILTVLLEKLGHAPQQRSRLFSQYYKVITQREQEKGGELSELLQRYESDVDYLHRFIGNLLQMRSSEAGDASSTITREEFDNIIAQRLTDQEHDPDEVARLRIEFSRLVTDRLVFLALLTSEVIGFELRSFQEFMAAEWVIALPESEIIPRLKLLSMSSFWRNVSLFIAGGIFGNRESMKADVTHLCSDLNMEVEAHALLKPGSDFALDILLDGCANSQPGYIRALSKTACEIVDGPPHPRLGELATVSDTAGIKLIRSVARDSSPCNVATRLNRARLLAGLALNGEVDDFEFLRSYVQRADRGALTALAEIAAKSRDGRLESLLNELISRCDPADLARFSILDVSDWESSIDADSADREVAWTESFSKLARLSRNRTQAIKIIDRFATVDSKINPFMFTFSSVQDDYDMWEWVLQIDGGVGMWPLLRSIARFCLQPTANSLSDALALASIHPYEDAMLFRSTPWVLRACLQNAHSLAIRDGEAAYGDQLRFLSTAALDGKLGDLDVWTAAEMRWSAGINIGTDLSLSVDDESERNWDNPLPRELALSGVALSGMHLRARRVSADGRDSVEFVTNLIQSILPCTIGGNRSALLDAISFFSGILFEENRRGRHTNDVDHMTALRKHLTEIDWGTGSGLVWPMWLTVDETFPASAGERSLLLALGSRSRFRVPSIRKISNYLSNVRAKYDDVDVSWPILRIQIAIDPLYLAEKQREDYVPSGNTQYAEEILSIWTLSNSTLQQWVDGSCDEILRKIAADKKSVLGLDWLISYMQSAGDDWAVKVGAHAASLIIGTDSNASLQLVREASLVLASIPPEL
ncbi:hypothetical protein BJD99_12175 [Rhodococcus sp. 1163]|uniref:NACHT domain-containing protein n=1 Tax=Rhodococcus sp. 1163 TaxID=1905289 RepID=UPI000A03A41D|nr:hypothetical protein [Rhodococcus sp. 1163]ORI13868.1 hypothetical protein BJD99_12175 [Rhodococcus sp. 1163]